jgi:hypothetical protein
LRGVQPMSWSELQRLVEEAEADGAIRRSLRRCRSRGELLMASRRMGYRIQATDLRRAWQLEQVEAGRLTPADPGTSFWLRQAGD